MLGGARRGGGIRLLASAAVCLVTLSVAGCSHASPPPLPLFDKSGVGFESLAAKPGTIFDFGEILGSSGTNVVKLTGVSLIGLAGYKLPSIVHLALLPAGIVPVYAALGWPPARTRTTKYLLLPALGTSVSLAKDRPREVIIGVESGRAYGPYAFAGVVVRYEIDGVAGSCPVYGAGFVWNANPALTGKAHAAADRQYEVTSRQAFARLEKMPAVVKIVNPHNS